MLPPDKFTIIVELDEDGYYFVHCPELKGCASQGRTWQEALPNIQEAMELWLEVQEEKQSSSHP